MPNSNTTLVKVKFLQVLFLKVQCLNSNTTLVKVKYTLEIISFA